MIETLGAARKIDSKRISIDFLSSQEIDGVHIGKVVLPAETLRTWIPNQTVLDLINMLNGSGDKSKWLREYFVFGLNNNTPNSYGKFLYERPLSAYYTYDPKNTAVIIEWGTVDSVSDESKLHDYLNRNIDFQDRAKQGMRISSGHLALLKGKTEHLALFDDVTIRSLPEKNGLRHTINTLHQYGIIPITAEGYVQLPIF